jgi:RNA polymerase sigma factor (sigma-70 family)
VGTIVTVADPPRPRPGDDGALPGDDRQVVDRLLVGDPDALDEIYRRYGSACYRIAHRVTVNVGLAEDCVQEAFLGLWHRPDRFDADAGSLRSWLLAMTHHKAVDVVRREAAQQRRRAAASAVRSVDGPLPDDPAESACRALRDEGVRSALADLPDAQREALALAYYGGYTQREIAGLTGVPLGTVKTRMLAGMRRLRVTLALAVDPDGAR